MRGTRKNGSETGLLAVSRLLTLALVGVVAACWVPAVARADWGEDAPEYWLSVRPSLGPGAGSQGIGGRLGAAGEYWLTGALGFGLQGALFGEGVIGGVSAVTLGPAVGVRTSSGASYAALILGGGYARVKRTEDSLCIDLFGTGCSEPVITYYDGYAVAGAFGWLTHPSDDAFEVGPVLRLDIVDDFADRQPAEFLVTLNFAFGFGLIR